MTYNVDSKMRISRSLIWRLRYNLFFDEVWTIVAVSRYTIKNLRDIRDSDARSGTCSEPSFSHLLDSSPSLSLASPSLLSRTNKRLKVLVNFSESSSFSESESSP